MRVPSRQAAARRRDEPIASPGPGMLLLLLLLLLLLNVEVNVEVPLTYCMIMCYTHKVSSFRESFVHAREKSSKALRSYKETN